MSFHHPEVNLSVMKLNSFADVRFFKRMLVQVMVNPDAILQFFIYPLTGPAIRGISSVSHANTFKYFTLLTDRFFTKSSAPWMILPGRRKKYHALYD